MTKLWQAAEARNHFTDLVDEAVQGEPQFIKRRDGREVVVVSRDYFEKTRPTLKSFLLKPGYVPDGDDPIDQILADIREEGTFFLFSGLASGDADGSA